MCQMQCQNGYDVLQRKFGQFVCTYGGGTWNPSDAVPDCNGTSFTNISLYNIDQTRKHRCIREHTFQSKWLSLMAAQ